MEALMCLTRSDKNGFITFSLFQPWEVKILFLDLTQDNITLVFENSKRYLLLFCSYWHTK